MKVEILSVQNPIWANEKQTIIDCFVKTNILGDQIVPFSATADDVEDHGKILFSELLSGKYGQIEKYVPPKIDESNFPTHPTGEIPLATF